MATRTISLNDGKTPVSFGQKLVSAAIWLLFVFIWVFSAASPPLFFIFLFLGYYQLAAVIILATMVAYAPWQKNSFTRAFQHFIKMHSPYHFPKVQIVIEGDMPKESAVKECFGVHPHGAFCLGWSFLFINDSLMDHVRFCFSPYLLASPFFRIFCRASGKPGSVNRASMKQYMKENEESIALVPGGFEEASLTCPTQDRVFIKKRYGFIKLCLECGMTHVRPIYTFGEKDAFWNLQGMWKLRFALNKMGFPTLFMWGHALVPLIPKNKSPLMIVIGAPVILPKLDRPPTKEEVATYHAKYVASLTRLYDEHKVKAYGPKGKTMKLEVW